MIAIQITHIREFMNKLFLSGAFDTFLLSEAAFVTFSTFRISGQLHREYYSGEELENSSLGESDYASWQQIRPFALSLIKGTHTPLEFKIVFRMSQRQVEQILSNHGPDLHISDVGGLFMNLHYKGGELTCTTGTALNIFSMDRSLEQEWDQMVKKFLFDYC